MEPLSAATHDGSRGEDEVDGETRVIEVSSTDALKNHFLRLRNNSQQSVRRIMGFPDPPPPPKSFWERLARFFGVDEDQAELKSWRIRHALALQGYLKREHVPQLRDYETDEVDTVCFRWKVKTQDQERLHLDPAHSTGRSFEYRELCRPNPPSKAHVWVMFWEFLEYIGHRLNIWRKNRAVQVRAFGDNIVEQFQTLVEDIKSRDSADGAVSEEEDEEPEELTFFDSRSYPLSFSADGEDETDGPELMSSSLARPLKDVFTERAAERQATDGNARRGHRTIEQEKPARQSDRSKTNFGLISFILGRRYKPGTIDSATADKLSDVYSYRPYFMYWASTVHILVLIISLAQFGFAPVGVGNKVETTNVAAVTGGSVSVEREIERNFWFGPTFTNLIHLGAKYGPCMRQDKRIFDEIVRERGVERDLTACCVRTDSQICFQSTQAQCTENFFRWLKWTGNATVQFTNNIPVAVPTYSTPSLVSQANPATCFTANNVTRCYRTSGSVCGQDPMSCIRPASTAPFEWVDDISRWPVCAEDDSVVNVPSTSCEVTGRPCCVGKQGVCTIATEEHCNYVNGFYHGDKRLCSEVNCLEDICGLTSFLNQDHPDQFYRLWTSLCLHVGILHLVLTLIMHMTIGRHIEKLIGWFRVGMIYVLSGIGGNLVSAVFVPYQAEVGPGPALFGLMACLVVDAVKERHLLERPWREVTKILAIVTLAIFMGFLPFIDNYAHVGGFVMGLFTSVLFVPYIGQSLAGVNDEGHAFSRVEKRWFRLYHIGSLVVAFLAIVAFFLLFFLLFYDVQPACKNCSYFNCIPLTKTLCDDLAVDLSTRSCHVCQN
ncbi:inactive rhomboid protein 1-like isoform X2 [Sycon ciliatum]|uniref:inactive rhomboid protein 1-like isoform X2 n=1 Tax=Sycon ciliatum TaxID=27933 RepID=UPI0020AB827F|eukprot:scpid28352/ scgid0042/ Inactive rhomboid protein 1; Rhomboid family member 1